MWKFNAQQQALVPKTTTKKPAQQRCAGGIF
jgi:hypothetical protein